MKRVLVTIDTGYYDVDYQDIVEVSDDATEDDIEQAAMDYLFNHISLDWEVLKDE